MDFKNKALAINSILIVISSSIIGTVLHELAHYVTAAYLHLKPELHHNYVRPLAEGTPLQYTIMAAAGPIFSLVFGLLVMFVSIKYLKPSLLRLFMTWISLLPTLFMPMTYFATWGEYKKLTLTDAEVTIDKVSIPLSILTILSIILFRYLV